MTVYTPRFFDHGTELCSPQGVLRDKVRQMNARPAAWSRSRLEVVAFVQDERTGSVLQAMGAHQCAVS